MIAVDTSTLVAYFSGESVHDTHILHDAIIADQAALCPIVITEALSGTADRHIKSLLAKMNLLSFKEDFWERAGESRQKLLRKGLKALVADAVIAQSAIDHDIPLLTRDRYFRHYATHCGLKMA